MTKTWGQQGGLLHRRVSIGFGFRCMFEVLFLGVHVSSRPRGHLVTWGATEPDWEPRPVGFGASHTVQSLRTFIADSAGTIVRFINSPTFAVVDHEEVPPTVSWARRSSGKWGAC